MPGKIAELIFFAMSSSLVRIMPPRGPRSVLCVVVVTTWACGNGLGMRPAATRPAKCAMSTRKCAPTSSAMARNAGEIDLPRIGRAAGDDDARLVLMRELTHLIHIDQVRVGLAPCSARP